MQLYSFILSNERTTCITACAHALLDPHFNMFVKCLVWLPEIQQVIAPLRMEHGDFLGSTIQINV